MEDRLLPDEEERREMRKARKSPRYPLCYCGDPKTKHAFGGGTCSNELCKCREYKPVKTRIKKIKQASYDPEALSVQNTKIAKEIVALVRKSYKEAKKDPVSDVFPLCDNQPQNSKTPKAKLSNARLFVLRRIEDASGVSGTGIVAEGTEYSNGKITLHWLSHLGTIAVYDSMVVLTTLHGHDGKTVVEYME